MPWDDSSYSGSGGQGPAYGNTQPVSTNEDANVRGTRRYNMGGRSQPPPQQATPAQEAAAQIQIENERAKREATDRARVAAEKAAADTAQKNKTAGDITRLFGQGRSYGTTALGDLGYADTYGIMDRYLRELNAAKAGVPEMATNVGSYFDYGDLFKAATSEAQGVQQGKLSNAYTAAAPAGWETTKWGDTADDAILSAILGEQKGGAETDLKNALARGQMSQGAYDLAIGNLGTKATSANAKLQDIGGGVLGKYRTELGDIGKAFSDQITNYKLGQNVDVGQFNTNVGNKYTGQQGRLEGDIYSALGDTELFDVNALMSKAAGRAGAVNQPLAGGAALPTGAQTDEEMKRTTGTSGAF